MEGSDQRRVPGAARTRTGMRFRRPGPVVFGAANERPAWPRSRPGAVRVAERAESAETVGMADPGGGMADPPPDADEHMVPIERLPGGTFVSDPTRPTRGDDESAESATTGG